MPTYYVDSAGSNTAPYDTWAKAAQDPNTIEAVPIAAGDTVYARGTFTGTWTWAVSGTSLLSAGAITWIGCAADGTPYGGQFVVDRAAGGNQPVDCAAKTHRITHNVTATNGNFEGFNSMGFSSVFSQCIAEANGRYGFENAGAGTSHFYNCISRNNAYGFYNVDTSLFAACYAYNNSSYGFYVATGTKLIHCGAYDNDTDNIIVTSTNCAIVSCFAHSSSGGSGIHVTDFDGYCSIMGCALTNNNQYGIEVDAGNVNVYEDYNGFLNNGVADRTNCPTGRHSGTFAADPYVNSGAGNFSTSDTASFRRTEIDMEFA